MLPILSILVSVCYAGTDIGGTTALSAPPNAVISLFNPTNWDGPVLVEIPVGRIASQGLLDWDKIQLQIDGKELPFSIREGRPHSQVSLSKHRHQMRAEDLLVFSCSIQPNTWQHVEVRSGAIKSQSFLTHEEGRSIIAYPGVRVTIDEKTGALLAFDTNNNVALSQPFTPSLHHLTENAYTFSGQFGVGYQVSEIKLAYGEAVNYGARMVSSSSTASMTELNFLLEPPEGPALALTYRIHAFGMLEIALDERPWSGESPWLHYAVRTALSLQGSTEPIPLLESRTPFYGFKEYTAAYKEVTRFHKSNSGSILEFGDEAINGRRFYRRLYAFPAERNAQAAELVKSVNEGFVVEVEPVHSDKFNGACVISSLVAPTSFTVKLLEDTLGNAVTDKPSGAAKVRFHKTDSKTLDDLVGDGFSINVSRKGELVIRTRTQLGQFNATQALARHFKRLGNNKSIPLIARNPIVPFRAGGFGGGNFEVDFPYGTDEEWQGVFDGLLDSGMNVFGCLGMWGDWKMPVSYKYMPELHSSEPDAYDESSGAKFVEFDKQRDRGLRLAQYLHDRGAGVWLWIPIGCAPTTFPKLFPEAMAPGSTKVPCFTHPEYKRYINAFFRELLETYPIDGFFLIRDDNGGICTCDRCKEYVAKSRTKDAVWEQYLVIYDWLRAYGFKGGVGVYPYNDFYQPHIDPLLPRDLYVLGHGGGAAVLTREYEHLAPMGDTWIDNLYANFRIAPSPRMKRLLSDRSSFWIGGAYCGTELPWESIGYFGWEPSATPNSLRYNWGARRFGKDGAIPFLRMNEQYEKLWDINALNMSPAPWMKLPAEERKNVVAQGVETVEQFKARLADLKKVVPPEQHARWYGHVDLFAPFFEYHLHRLDRFADIYARVNENRDAVERPEGLSKEVRDLILADYTEMYAWADKYNTVMQKAPDGMLTQCRWMTKPYKEWMAGYDQYLDVTLARPQFAGSAKIETEALQPGKPFTLRIELHNKGICPWVAGAGHRVEFSGVAATLGLPATWEYEGAPMAPGDHRTIEFHGIAPKEPGEGDLILTLLSPYRIPEKVINEKIHLVWQTPK